MATPTPPTITTSSTHPRVGLRVHPRLPMLAFDEGVVVQQLLDATIAAVPMCAPWFRGVARHGGQIVPFFDMATWAGVDRAKEHASTMVSIVSGHTVLGLLSSESPRVLAAGHVVVPWAGKDDWCTRISVDATVHFDAAAWLAEVASHVSETGRRANSARL